MGFLRFVIILFAIFYLLYIIGSFFLKRQIKKVKKNFEEAQNQSKNSGKKEGEVYVDFNPKTKKNISDKEGEYVDFEEVE
ncbi:MAG: hypothetical protein ABIJ97_11230 [Bacteroidota bacterium]